MEIRWQERQTQSVKPLPIGILGNPTLRTNYYMKLFMLKVNEDFKNIHGIYMTKKLG